MLSALLNSLARTRAALCRRARNTAHGSSIPHQGADASEPDEDSPSMRSATRRMAT